ncbi:hypothetical protein BC835DRAFT_1036402 [Cytidiella melzeri]|nr:hypothetical protein BC835DRAFT_1036402 [Cytidiella melzeri]
MSTPLECRLCHKGDVLGLRGIMLTCGLCKRNTHHSCLTPPMRYQDLQLLLESVIPIGAPQFGHPKVWICPRCSSRNPPAAKETVLGRAATMLSRAPSLLPTNAKKTEPSPIPGPSRQQSKGPVSGAAVKADMMVIDKLDSDGIEEVVPAPKLRTKPTIQTLLEDKTDLMIIDSDDDIKFVDPPIAHSRTSRASLSKSKAVESRISQASRTKNLATAADITASNITADSKSRSDFLRLSNGANVHLVVGGSRPLHPLPQKPNFELADTSNNVRSKKTRVRRRRRPDPDGHSDSSQESTRSLLKKRKVEASEPAHETQSPSRTVSLSTAVALDIRAIQAQLRAQGKLAPPPSHVYTNRSPESNRDGRVYLNGPQQRAPSSDSRTSDSNPKRPPSNAPGVDKEKGHAIPLFMPDSEGSEDDLLLSEYEAQRRQGGESKGKGRAFLPDDAGTGGQADVKVKPENHDNETLASGLRLFSARRKNKSPLLCQDKGLAPDLLRERQQVQDEEDRHEMDKLLANRKFRSVEKQESGVLSPRKAAEPHKVARLSTAERLRKDKDGLEWINWSMQSLRLRESVEIPSASAQVKREIPRWML